MSKKETTDQNCVIQLDEATEAWLNTVSVGDYLSLYRAGKMGAAVLDAYRAKRIELHGIGFAEPESIDRFIGIDIVRLS
jgi:hypothetical protein